MAVIEVAHDFYGDISDVFQFAAYRRPAVGVRLEREFAHNCVDIAVGLVQIALLELFHHHLTLHIHLVLFKGDVAHTVTLHPECKLRVLFGKGYIVVRHIVVGVGIGGTFDKAAFLAKKALLRCTDERNADPFWAALEEEMLQRINELGIGPQGFGGKTTALCVNIEPYPCHIASLPVAVNINCHVTRHAKEVI